MLIALCLFKYFPYGGLQRDFMAIGKELHKRGHKIRVYTRTWQGEKPEEFEIILTPVRAFTNHGANAKYYHWVKKHLESHPVDVVVGFNRMPGLDFYYDADVCYAEKIEEEKKGLLYRLSSRCRHYLEYEQAVFKKGGKTKILLLSPVQQEYFQKHYQTESDRFYLLPPGISQNRRYQNAPKDARKNICTELNISDSSFLLLQIGSDFLRKGVDRSIKALASLPEKIKKNTHLIIIGQDKTKKLEHLAKTLGVKENTHFLLGRDDIPYFIAGCDLLLHPARSENTGTAILEALVGGLPEVVTEECGYASYVTIAESGLVLPSPFNQEQFNKEIKSIINSGLPKVWRKNANFFSDHEDLYSLTNTAVNLITKQD